MPSGRHLLGLLAIAAIAGGVFWLAYDDGTYGLTSRNSVAVILVWGLLLASALAFWPASRIPRAALVSGGLLAAFGAWTGLSALWAASPEIAFAEFDRVLLFLAVFALAVVASPLGSARRWLAGLAIGLTAISVLALVSRLFPHLFGASTQLAEAFPSARKRLSFPVDYWNGLATLVAFAIPATLYFAAEARAVVRGLAVAPLPAFAATLYLTSSRGGWVAAGIAIVVLIALTPRRWATAGAVVVGGAASVGAVAILLSRDELVDTPLQSAVAEDQGRSAALLIALLCLGAGVAYGLLARLVPAPPRASRAVAAGFAALLVVVAIAGLAAANPVERFNNFKEIPPELQGASVQEHLFSSSGNGRWQWWTSAFDEFQNQEPEAVRLLEPGVAGRGPGW